jgi:uncharacterized membrane protein
MPYLLATAGAAMLAYVVFLISGTGVAVLAFAGIMCIVSAIYWWLLQALWNARAMHDIQSDQHYDALRMLYNIEKKNR